MRSEVCRSASLSYRAVRIDLRELMKLLKHVKPKVEDVTLLRHYSHPSVPKSLQRDLTLLHMLTSDFYDYLKDTVCQISPHSMDALRTLGIVPSPMKVTRLALCQEIILETTLAFPSNGRAGTTDAIALRLSLRESKDGEKPKACFSVERVGVIGSGPRQSFIGASASGGSHHAVVDTPHISDGILDLDSNNDSRIIIPFDNTDMLKRKIAHTEYTVLSEEMWDGSARLLRIALQHTFNAGRHAVDRHPSYLWLSIDISEELPYVLHTKSGVDSPSSEQTDTDVCERDSDSETSNDNNRDVLSFDSTRLPIPVGNGDTRYATLESVETLRQEKGALRLLITDRRPQRSSQMEIMDQTMYAMLAGLDSSASTQSRQSLFIILCLS